ncbi:MAG: hypothetical protein U5K43_13650 [Halofilum sp. (in: g-proteobacteria)]|nr:hypothetical protein [Halofilum sp. (in: g-proteobacteria)]
MARLDEADALLVVGSSLMVFSGYRFVRAARRAGSSVAVVNLRAHTRRRRGRSQGGGTLWRRPRRARRNVGTVTGFPGKIRLSDA